MDINRENSLIESESRWNKFFVRFDRLRTWKGGWRRSRNEGIETNVANSLVESRFSEDELEEGRIARAAAFASLVERTRIMRRFAKVVWNA